MAEINHLIGIRGSVAQVYAALSTVDGLAKWWTAETTGSPTVGGVIQFRFGDYGGPDMKVVELTENVCVRWECVKHPSEWAGTKFTFTLKEEGGQVYLRFRQAEWKEAGDFLAFCSTKWALFLIGLKEYVESGTGRPYPHDLQTTH